MREKEDLLTLLSDSNNELNGTKGRVEIASGNYKTKGTVLKTKVGAINIEHRGDS